MKYRIELEMIDRRYRVYDKNEYVFGALEVKTFLAECVPNGYRVVKIVKITKDGRAQDVTNKYIA